MKTKLLLLSILTSLFFTSKLMSENLKPNIYNSFIINNIVNNPPVAVDDLNNTTLEDTSITISTISANDTDDVSIDPTAILLIDPSNSSNTGNSTTPLIISGIGNYTVDNLGNVTFNPETNFHGTANVKYSIKDNQGLLSNIATVFIAVSPVNDAPVAVPDTNVTSEDTILTVTGANGLLNNDSDIDGDNIVVTLFTVSGTSYVVGTTANLQEGDIIINADGSYTFTPTANFNGTFPQITYTVSDGTSSVTSTLDLTVTPVNDVPIAVPDTNTTTENTSLTVTTANGLLSNDTDIDGDFLSVLDIIINGTSYTVGAPIVLQEGTITISTDGSYVFAPANNFSGAFPQILYTISDGFSNASSTLNITVIPSGNTNVVQQITGNINLDLGNNNCVSGSSPMPNIQLKTTGVNGTYFATTNANGDYTFSINESGAVTTEVIANGFTANPINYSNTFVSGTSQTVSNQDFCMASSIIGDDVSVLIIPITDARPGFISTYRVQYSNSGNTTVSGNVVLNFEDNKTFFVSANQLTSSVTSNSLTWNYSNLLPFETRDIDVTFTNNTPTQAINPLNSGDLLNFLASITPLTSDISQNDNNFTLVQPVVNAYDPNDATILEGPHITALQATQDLNFRIRFQNTGSASAINVNVKTLLDVDLDWATFIPISASHSYSTTLNPTTGEVNFNFSNINLPDNTTDPAGSNGWILFKAKPKSTFAIGDIVDCGADIVFDFNSPIITNVAQTQIPIPNATYVPDDAFEQALIDLGYDSGVLDNYVLTANINTITSLNISDPTNNPNLPNVNAKISDLTGIEDFVSLKTLNASDNQIVNLNISKNILLEDIRLTRNLLTNLDVSKNTKLKVLYTDENNLTTLNVNFNLDLELLYCGKNQILSLDVSKNLKLHSLAADNNNLTHIDVCNNKALVTLVLDYNNLKAIDVRRNNLLTSLSAINNNLSSLNIANGNNINIYTLFIINNPNLTCITADIATPAIGLAAWTLDAQNNFSATLCANSLTYVPDDNLENYLETHDANGNMVAKAATTSMGNALTASDPLDNYVFTSRIQNVTKLAVPNLSIASMTGIQDFASLKYLDCSTNLLTSINISKNLDLEDFRCDDNKLSALDVTNNVKLFNIAASKNLINTLDVSSNIDLKTLELYDNKLSTLDVSKNLKLEQLGYGDNLFTTSVNTDLNLSLEFLRCDLNAISNLNVTKNTKLISLIAGDSNIATIDFSKNTKLRTVSFLRSPLTSLDFSNNPILKELFLDTTQLTGLDVSANPILEIVFVKNNPLLANLNIANGNNANFLSLDIKNNPNLTCITADAATPNVGLTGWLKDAAHNFNATCASQQITLIPDANFEQRLIALNIDTDGVINGQVFTADINTITTLNVNSSNISDLKGIEDFVDLNTLFISNNQLSNLDFSNNMSLSVLYCNGNNLTNLNVSQNTALTQLYTNGNNLTNLNLTQNTALIYLQCNDNQLTSLDVSKNTSLIRLKCQDNQIAGVFDVSQNIALNIFECKNNLISDLDISNNTGLSTLRCQNNKLTTLILNANLKTLEAQDNLLSNVNFTVSPLLEFLTINNNLLQSLDFSQNQNLKGITASNNLINELDLSNNLLLTNVYADNNLIDKVMGLDKISGLIQFHVTNNKITKLDFSNNPSLSTLQCSGNKLTSLNLKNSRVNSFSAKNNLTLTCIEVDFYQYSNWSYYTNAGLVDSQSIFNTDCSAVWSVMTSSATTTVLLTIPNLDADNDGAITVAEAAAFTGDANGELNLSGTGITDVEGLQAFTSILQLDVSGNGITDLSPLTNSTFGLIAKSTGKTKTIRKTTAMALETIVLNDNSFEVLDFNTLTNLKNVDISNNPN
ncbi:DUF7619 domain-containing protein, partial [Polaribacter haliotis]